MGRASGVVKSRAARFWIVGIPLILGNTLVPLWRLYAGGHPTITELGFHGAMVLAGISLLDSEKGKEIVADIRALVPFLRKGS